MTSSTQIPERVTAHQTEANRAVQATLAFSSSLQQQTLARMVAATICEESDSALERFASTGTLDSQAVLDELERVEVPFEQEAWVDALARFALFDNEAHHG